jgi:hypothetical protein
MRLRTSPADFSDRAVRAVSARLQHRANAESHIHKAETDELTQILQLYIGKPIPTHFVNGFRPQDSSAVFSDTAACQSMANTEQSSAEDSNPAPPLSYSVPNQRIPSTVHFSPVSRAYTALIMCAHRVGLLSNEVCASPSGSRSCLRIVCSSDDSECDDHTPQYIMRQAIFPVRPGANSSAFCQDKLCSAVSAFCRRFHTAGVKLRRAVFIIQS